MLSPDSINSLFVRGAVPQAAIIIIYDLLAEIRESIEYQRQFELIWRQIGSHWYSQTMADSMKLMIG